jgi:hypothetical protein
MKTRFTVIALALVSCYVPLTACGDDEEPATPAPSDGGNDATTDTSTPDTSQPDVVSADVAPDRPELTGQSCTAPTDCYPGLDAAALKGAVVCLDKVQGGHCTHECTKDEDCCAVPGECKSGLKQVCASFTNQGAKYCFLSCEPADIANAADAGIDAGGSDQAFCTGQVSAEFNCRSTGGGSGNAKACLPAGGDGGPPNDASSDAADASDAADGAG